MEEPDLEAYVAVLSVDPVSNSKVGVPLVVSIVTASEKVTLTVIESPAL